MKRWLRKKLLNILHSNESEIIRESPQLVGSKECMDNDPVLNFRVFNAVGGKVVEFTHYDRKTDRRNSTTYIITNEQDFGERISKIATMESLKV